MHNLSIFSGKALTHLPSSVAIPAALPDLATMDALPFQRPLRTARYSMSLGHLDRWGPQEAKGSEINWSTSPQDAIKLFMCICWGKTHEKKNKNTLDKQEQSTQCDVAIWDALEVAVNLTGQNVSPLSPAISGHFSLPGPMYTFKLTYSVTHGFE